MKRTLLLLILSLHAFAAGRELAPGVYGPSALTASNPLVAFAGGTFLTVWREYVGGHTRIAGAFSDAHGHRAVGAGGTSAPLRQRSVRR